MNKCLLAIGLWLSMPQCISSQIVIDRFINQKKPLNYDVNILAVDSIISASKAYKSIKTSSDRNEFNPVTPGYSNDYYWVLIDLKSDAEQEVLIEIASPHIDSVALFSYYQGTFIKMYESGDQFPFHTRPYKSRNIVFPLIINSARHIYLLRIHKTSSSLNMPIYLWERNNLNQHNLKRSSLEWIFFGIIIAIIISSFIIYGVLKDNTFGLFGLYALFGGLFIFGSYGYAAQFLFADFPQANDFFRPTISWANSIFGILFFNSFLKINVNHPTISLLLKAIVAGLILLFLIAYHDIYWTYQHGIIILNILILLMLIAICLILWAAIKTYPIERFRVITFFISSFFVFLGSLTYVFISYGFVDSIILSVDPVALGRGAEITGFSISLIAIVQVKKSTKSFSKEYLSSTLFALIDPIKLEEIGYISSQDHHCYLHTVGNLSDKSIRISINKLCQLLPKESFVQTHRSYIVNANYIKVKYANKLILHSGKEVPISRSYKKELDAFLNDSKNH